MDQRRRLLVDHGNQAVPDNFQRNGVYVHASFSLLDRQICVTHENFYHREHKVATEISEIYLWVLWAFSVPFVVKIFGAACCVTLLVRQICVTHDNYGTRITRIERIFTDLILFYFIRVNPYDPPNPCSIFGCGFDMLRITHK